MPNPAFQEDAGGVADSDTGDGDTGESTGGETGDGTGSSSSGDTSDGPSETDTSDGPTTTDGMPMCGNGMVDPGESCDGEGVHNGDCVDCDIICDEGFDDCNGDPLDGCEVDLLSDTLSCGYCSHDCLGGECEDGWCLPVQVAEGQSGPYDIVVDEKNAYWVNRTGGTVMYAPKDGDGIPQQIAKSQEGPTGITVVGDDVFWTNNYAGTVMRAKLGDVAVVFAAGQNFPFAITSSDTHVWWTNHDSGAIHQKSINGGNESPAISMGQAGSRYIHYASNRVAWTAAAGGGSVAQFDLGDNGQGALAVGLGAEMGGLYSDGEWVYFAVPNPGYVAKVPTEGGDEPMQLADGLARPRDIVFDDELAYWTHQTGGEVVWRSRAGGEVELLAESPDQPWAIAHDEVSIFWTDLVDGSIWRVAKP